jgi:hypothetical protein
MSIALIAAMKRAVLAQLTLPALRTKGDRVQLRVQQVRVRKCEVLVFGKGTT